MDTTEYISLPCGSPESLSAIFDSVPDLGQLENTFPMSSGALEPADAYAPMPQKQEYCETPGFLITETLNVPPDRYGPPDQECMPGELDFKVNVLESKKCLYSTLTNKVYVMPFSDFAVEFSWASALHHDVYVRACVAFTDQQYAEQRVETCLSHRPLNVEEHIRHNVLVSSRAGATGVVYHGAPSRPHSWYSTLVVFSPGARRTHAYRFVCTNNCSAEGITRRNIAIVFTLENVTGHVLGRQTVGAKACACPARDKRKDEEGLPGHSKKRPVAPGTLARTKKVKIEAPSPGLVDDVVFTLPQDVQVVGAIPLVAGLETMLRTTEHGLSLRREDPQYAEACRASIAGLKVRIDQIKRDHGIP